MAASLTHKTRLLYGTLKESLRFAIRHIDGASQLQAFGYRNLEVSSRMQSSCNKDDQSLTPFFITCSSLWNSTEQPKYSPSKSTVTEQELSPDDFHGVKQLDSQILEQDSSSTLTSCQSHYGMADAERYSPSVQYIGSPRDRNHGTSFLYGNPESGFDQVQLNYNKSAVCLTFPCSEPHFGGLVAAYGQNHFIYPPMVGLTCTRVPLPPLECAESIPILVNAKQFRAILRRRQMRAKLEAKNKIVKSPKPYLHESRHVHALKRPRGAGGRFLNTKNIKKSQLSFPGHCQDISKKIFAGEVPGSEAQHSESGSLETSAPSGSDVTSIFNGVDIFQQPEVRSQQPLLTAWACLSDKTRHV